MKKYIVGFLGFLLTVVIIMPIVARAQTDYCVGGKAVEGKSSPAKNYICQAGAMNKCASGNVCLAGRCQPENYNKLDLFAPFKPELKTIIFVSGAGEPSPNFAWEFYRQFKGKFNFVYFSYDYSQKTEVNARKLNDRVKEILVAYPNQEFKIVAHSMGHLVARTAILMANGLRPPESAGVDGDITLAKAYANSEFYSVSGVIGGSHYAYFWNAPDSILPGWPLKWGEMNPTGQFQTWLFSADRVQNFNFEVKGYHSFDSVGDPHLIDLANCSEQTCSPDFRQTVRGGLQEWWDNYKRGISSDHVKFPAIDENIDENLTPSNRSGFTPERAEAMLEGLHKVWGTADKNFCQNNKTTYTFSDSPLGFGLKTRNVGHSVLLFHPTVIAEILKDNKPNLWISDNPSFSVAPTSTPAGGTVTLSNFKVMNDGNVPSDAFLGIYLSTDDTISTTSDTLLGTISLPSIATGSSYTARTPTFTISANTPAGSYYVGAIVDPANAVKESNENDNALEKTPLTVSVGASAGNKSLAVILFNFRDDVRKPFLKADVEAKTFTNPDSVSAYWREVSFGKLNLTGKVFDWVTIPTKKPVCLTLDDQEKIYAANNLAKTVVAAAHAEGYDYYVFAAPQFCLDIKDALKVEGFFVSGTNFVFFNDNLFYKVFTTAHELGHAFGLGHANALDCFSLTDPGRSLLIGSNNSVLCQGATADPFSVMGDKETRHISAFQKMALGWLDRATVQTITQGGTYDIQPAEISSGRAVIRIPIDRGRLSLTPDPDGFFNSTDQLYYYLDYRIPYGIFDAGISSGGVRVFIGKDFPQIPTVPTLKTLTPSKTYLVDVTPSTDSLFDAVIKPGNPFEDLERGIKIETLSADSKGVRVKITFTPTLPNLWLSDAIPFSVTPTSVQAGGMITLSNFKVMNDGNVPSDAFLGIYLSRDDNVSTTSDTLLGTISLPTIAARSSYTARTPTLTIPAGTPAGNYYVGAIVDPDNVVKESNENDNNLKKTLLTVTKPPPSPPLPPPILPQSDTTPPTVEIVSITPGEALLDANKHIMGYLPTKIKAQAKDSSGISKFNICVGNGINNCVSICGKTTGTGYVSCSSSFNPIDFANQILRIVAVAYDGAPSPNRGEDSVQFPISVTANTDSSCIGCSGIVVFKPDPSGSKIIVPPPPPPSANNGDTTPPTLRLTPGAGATTLNRPTTVTLSANDPSGLAGITIIVKASTVATPLVQTCDLTVAHPQAGSCVLVVPANQWVTGTVIAVSAIDYSSNRNPAFDGYKLILTGQLRGN